MDSSNTSVSANSNLSTGNASQDLTQAQPINEPTQSTTLPPLPPLQSGPVSYDPIAANPVTDSSTTQIQELSPANQPTTQSTPLVQTIQPIALEVPIVQEVAPSTEVNSGIQQLEQVQAPVEPFKTLDTPVVSLIKSPLETAKPESTEPRDSKKSAGPDKFNVLIALLTMILVILLVFVAYLVYQLLNLPTKTNTQVQNTTSYPTVSMPVSL